MQFRLENFSKLVHVTGFFRVCKIFKQTDTDCLPAALSDKKIAHKIGLLDVLYDDGGIIFSDAGDAVLVIMTENFTDEHDTIQHMKSFIRAVIK